MYLTHAQTLAVEAFRAALTEGDHPSEAVFGKDVWVGAEYPASEANYPGFWISFEPGRDLRRAGIGHTEYRTDPESGDVSECTRWTFSGTISVTVVTIGSRRQRDEMLDEVIRLCAFAGENDTVSRMKGTLEDNDLIAMSAAFETLAIGGLTSSNGTPWGSDDIMHEGTVSFGVEGEFVSDLKSTKHLVPISQILVTPEVDLSLQSGDARPGQWH